MVKHVSTYTTSGGRGILSYSWQPVIYFSGIEDGDTVPDEDGAVSKAAEGSGGWLRVAVRGS